MISKFSRQSRQVEICKTNLEPQGWGGEKDPENQTRHKEGENTFLHWKLKRKKSFLHCPYVKHIESCWKVKLDYQWSLNLARVGECKCTREYRRSCNPLFRRVVSSKSCSCECFFHVLLSLAEIRGYFPSFITCLSNAPSHLSCFQITILNLLKSQEKIARVRLTGINFASHWLKNWRDILEPITKRSNRKGVVTFDSQFNTALSTC